MFISDGCVTVRTPISNDAGQIARAIRSSFRALRTYLPWAKEDYSEEDALQWMRKEIEPNSEPMVIVNSAGEIVGGTGLSRVERLHRRAEIGYWVREDFSGRGIATAAVRLVAKWAMNEEHFERLELIISVENEPSRRVAEKAGAQYDGLLRSHLCCGDRKHDAHRYVFIAKNSAACDDAPLD